MSKRERELEKRLKECNQKLNKLTKDKKIRKKKYKTNLTASDLKAINESINKIHKLEDKIKLAKKQDKNYFPILDIPRIIGGGENLLKTLPSVLEQKILKEAKDMEQWEKIKKQIISTIDNMFDDDEEIDIKKFKKIVLEYILYHFKKQKIIKESSFKKYLEKKLPTKYYKVYIITFTLRLRDGLLNKINKIINIL